VRYAREAADAGADGILVALQSYFRLSEDEIVAHFEALASVTDLPIFIYNNVGTTGHDINARILGRLLEFPSVTGVKESSGRLERTMELQRTFGDRLQVFVGWEPLAFSMFQIGVKAWACGIGNFVPGLCVQLYEAAVVDRDFDRALEIHNRVAPLSDFILTHRLAACVKPGLEMMGIRAGDPRPPVTPIGPDLQAELRDLLICAGAL
jgi:4-hydroxy-tetrahydrodipicolinate synthase